MGASGWSYAIPYDEDGEAGQEGPGHAGSAE